MTVSVCVTQPVLVVNNEVTKKDDFDIRKFRYYLLSERVSQKRSLLLEREGEMAKSKMKIKRAT